MDMLKRFSSGAQSPLALLLLSRSTKNVVWNLVGGVWTGALIVLATPWYVARLGLEGYGIVGLWLMMQVMMGLLDMGMGATVIRGFADLRQDSDGHAYKRDLLKTLESVYWAVAALLVLAVVLSSGWVGEHWLHLQAWPKATIGQALRWMAIALGLQFPYALYSNGLVGLQEHGRMNALQIVGNGLRHGGGILVLLWRADLVWFFGVQAVVAGVQTLVVRQVLWRRITEAGKRPPLFRLELLRQVWRFSAGMAMTAIAAVLLANVDRLVLSKMMPTAELGKYAVAFTATGLLQLGIQPFYRAYFPRYSELVSSGDPDRLREEYYRSCRLMAAVILPLGIIGWVFAPTLLQAWLGRCDPTILGAFRWLLVGITGAGLMWLPAAFQQAHGWTNLHAAMIAGALVMGTPIMVWAIKGLGTVGATTVWVLHGVSDITLGLWLMHRRLLVGEWLRWYASVLLPPLLVSLPLAALSWWLMPQGMNRWVGLGWAVATLVLVILSQFFTQSVIPHKDFPSAKTDLHCE